MEATQMSINRWMDKEEVHVYHGMLLCHLRKWNNTIWSNMDGPGDCHTEWSKTENDKYCMLWLICVFLKKKSGTNELTYKTEIVIDVRSNLRVTSGEKNKG